MNLAWKPGFFLDMEICYFYVGKVFFCGYVFFVFLRV